MFKIRNISNGKIILGDLNLIINKGAEIDLDSLHPRERLEQSHSLHRCLQPEQNKLAIIHKDVISQQMDPKAVADMELRLRAQINEQMAMQPLPTTQPQEQESISELKKQLDFLIKFVTTQPVATQTSVRQEPTKEEATEESSERSIEIQQKLINRLVKNVESQVETKEETKKSDIGQRAGELEDLI